MTQVIVNYDEYMKLVSNCIELHRAYDSEGTLNLLNMALMSKHNNTTKSFIVDEALLHNLAVANLCDMALIQFRDSGGEIDYACLNERSVAVLAAIINNI